MRTFIALFIFYWSHFVLASVQHHIILKNDFNEDGISDRIVYASNGISGFYQSTFSNKKIDAFLIKQHSRSIFFNSRKDLGGPYIKTSEEVGIFSVISLWRYEENRFQLKASYLLPAKMYYSDAPQTCTDDYDPFSNNVIEPIMSFEEAVTKISVVDAIKRAIDQKCKTIFGKDYQKMENQIIEACEVSSGKDEKNNLISCLDRDETTRKIGGNYKLKLAETIFDDGFKISCEDSNKEIPLASFDSSSKKISFYQVIPMPKERDFKAEFFHEALHEAGVKMDDKVKAIIDSCQIKKKNKIDVKTYTSNTSFQQELEARKDGVEITVPQKELPAAPVSQAIATAEKTLDNNFSMGNDAQFSSLSKVSKATFKSFEPMMAAAYNAAIPVAFASDTIKVENVSTSPRSPAAIKSGMIAMPIAKTEQEFKTLSRTSDPTTSAEGVYSMPTLPGSQKAENGELGNGLNVTMAATVSSTKAKTGESPAIVAQQRATFQNLQAQAKGTLAANVPALLDDEEFLKTLTRGKYAEVRSKLNDPATAKILVSRRIQYLDRDKIIGSKQPTFILKDLGNGFAIRRVLVE